MRGKIRTQPGPLQACMAAEIPAVSTEQIQWETPGCSGVSWHWPSRWEREALCHWDVSRSPGCVHLQHSGGLFDTITQTLSSIWLPWHPKQIPGTHLVGDSLLVGITLQKPHCLRKGLWEGSHSHSHQPSFCSRHQYWKISRLKSFSYSGKDTKRLSDKLYNTN